MGCLRCFVFIRVCNFQFAIAHCYSLNATSKVNLLAFISNTEMLIGSNFGDVYVIRTLFSWMGSCHYHRRNHFIKEHVSLSLSLYLSSHIFWLFIPESDIEMGGGMSCVIDPSFLRICNNYLTLFLIVVVYWICTFCEKNLELPQARLPLDALQRKRWVLFQA